MTSNTLIIANLTREDLFASLTCHGSNSNLTNALVLELTIDMNCKYRSKGIKLAFKDPTAIL